MTDSKPTRVLPIASLDEQPWRNGGGMTRVLAAGAGWRVSLATVSLNGEFSVFEETRRHSVLIEGGAIGLRADDRTVMLMPHAVVHYRGDLRWHCHLQGCAATVLNVICEERRARAEIRLGEHLHLVSRGGPVIVLPVNCSATCIAEGALAPTAVPPGHVLVCERQSLDWTCTMGPAQPGAADAYLLAIRIGSIAPAYADVNEKR